MGLDDFASQGTTGTAVQNNQPTQDTSTPSEEKESKKPEEDAFKVVGTGPRKKIFDTEEDWEETADFIEDEMNLDIQEVLSMKSKNRHQILHRAILLKGGVRQASFHLTRDCVVCGHTFVFPKDWDFIKIKDEPTCSDHSIREVNQAVDEINDIQG